MKTYYIQLAVYTGGNLLNSSDYYINSDDPTKAQVELLRQQCGKGVKVFIDPIIGGNECECSSGSYTFRTHGIKLVKLEEAY